MIDANIYSTHIAALAEYAVSRGLIGERNRT